MDPRAHVFLQVMIAIVVVGVLAFLISLVAGYARRSRAAGAGGEAAGGPQWVEILLGLALLVVVAALLVWQLSSGRLLVWGETVGDWQGDRRSLAFLIVMALAGVLALIGFVVYAAVQAPRRQRLPVPVAQAEAPAAAQAGTEAAPAPVAATPSGLRLLGLGLLALGFLLLNWIYVPLAGQFALMRDLVYPAALGVALVLLFDKTSRAWSGKGTAETVREWLLCDALVLFLVLGYLNLRTLGDGEGYPNLFWDLLHIALFFATFWLPDRKTTRLRFLVVYGYFILLPVLLAIWRAVLGLEAPEELSWWITIWPFFILAIIFFVLEAALMLAPTAYERQVIPAVKDVVFLVLYAILLIAAIPEAAA